MSVMTKLKVLLSSFVLLASLVTMAQAQRGGRWQYLGEANVDGAVDHDRIRVSGGRPFRAIQIHVENSAINFDRVIVHFGNGQSTPLRMANIIPAGGKTRVIDLPGERRIIDNVEFYYRKANWNNLRRPKVRLFGMV